MGKKVTIMGLGGYKHGSGISAALFFAKQGAKVLITDLKPEKELKTQIKKLKKFKNITFVLGKHREKDFKNVDVIFQNPCVPDHSPYLKVARKNRIPIINDWNIFLQNCDNFLIGITGTKGKSTVASLVYQMVKTRYKNVLLCGNIGTSPLKYINLKTKPPIVAELSSWLLRGFKPVRKSPNIAVLTNLGIDHQDKYQSLKAYYKDKENIFKFQRPQDFFIVNRDNIKTKEWAKTARSQVYWFSKKFFQYGNGVYVMGRTIYFQQNKKTIKVCQLKDITIPGEHNLENVLASITTALVYGIPVSGIKKVLNRFKGIPHRLEFVRQINGVKYYNDTTATNPEAAIAGLKTFKSKKGKIILLGGGHDKNLDFSKYVKEANKCVKALILFKGTATDKILYLIGHKLKYATIIVLSMKQALSQTNKFAKRGDVVLLSPGAASFGLFKNELDRGNQFIKLVKKL